MTSRIPVLVACLCLAMACASDTPPTGPASVLPVSLTVNGRPGGTVFCGGELRFVTTLGNPTPQSVRVRGLTLQFSSFSDCATHSVSLTAAGEVGPGSVALVRSVDLAGDVCEEPYGRPGCVWRASAHVDTDAGEAHAQIVFATSDQDAPSCGADAPRIVAPADGATLSGVVTIRTVQAPDASGCPSPRTFVSALPIAAGPPAFSAFLDSGQEYRWKTVKSDDGGYVITAQKACGICVACVCGGVGDPVRISVKN